MWKKTDLPNPALNSSLDSVSTEQMGEMLMNIVRGANNPASQPPAAPQSESNDIQQQALLPMLQEYTESAEKCLKAASEFVRHASLIPEARDAYQNFVKTSAEIRRVLEKDERAFRALMDEVQKIGEMARTSADSLSDRKPAESSKIASMPLASGDNTKMSKFP